MNLQNDHSDTNLYLQMSLDHHLHGQCKNNFY